MSTGIVCQSCGVEAPTKRVTFYQNIGMLVMRRHRKIDGNLCKRCVHKHFWKMTGTTLVLGPWGAHSMIIAPCFVVNNFVRYLLALGMPAVPPDATVPTLTDKMLIQLQPFRQAIIDRLNKTESLVSVVNDIAFKAKVTPGQVLKYVSVIATQPPSPPPARGFSVQPTQPIEPQPIEPQAVLSLEPEGKPKPLVVGIVSKT